MATSINQPPVQQSPQPKKPHRLRKILLFVVGPIVTVIVLVVVLSVALSNSANKALNPVSTAPSAPSTPSAASASATTPSSSGPQQLALGQSASFVDNNTGGTIGSISVTATTTTKPADPSFGQPPVNGYYVIVTITAKCNSGYTQGWDTNALDFYALVNGSQYQWLDGNSMWALSNAQSSQAITATLGAGQSRTGYEAFDVPAPHGQIVYSPNLNGQPLAEWQF